MRNWIDFSIYSILFLSSLFLLVPSKAHAQSLAESSYSYPTGKLSEFNTSWQLRAHLFQYITKNYSELDGSPQGYAIREKMNLDTSDTVNTTQEFPDPISVMYKSLMLPGWGQVVNKQAWKVPIIYGALGGLVAYSVYLTRRYHDYRAAYYNLNPENPRDDMQYGPTPDYISEEANLEQLRSIRNSLRNRRDMVYVGTALAFGLNVVDAYVFAHMRSFDVSEDLSLRPRVKPSVAPEEMAPLVTVSVDLIY